MTQAADTIFYHLAAQNGISVEGQRDTLMAFIKDHAPEKFAEFVAELEKELAPPAPIPPKPAPQQAAAQMNAFFDRSLARKLLPTLCHLLEMPLPLDRPAQLELPEHEYALAQDILSGADAETAAAFSPGEMILGWYVTYGDGAEAMIMVTNGDATNPKPYVDAVLILPDTAPQEWANISLPPSDTLDMDFTFQYPDGLQRTIRLIP